MLRNHIQSEKNMIRVLFVSEASKMIALLECTCSVYADVFLLASEQKGIT